ncbi:MAG: hypothetical protein JXA14_19415, partial [Anaerolineae bacterium]|nr:hypothetical protein [Anaerolineae bacterium]
VSRRFSLSVAENQGVDSSNLSLGTTKTRSEGGFSAVLAYLRVKIGQVFIPWLAEWVSDSQILFR